MEVKYNLTVNLDKQDASNTIRMKQGDKNARVLYFHLMASGKPFPMEPVYAGSIKAIKSDGKVVFDTIAIEAGKVYYKIPDAMTDTVGEVACEIQLLSEDDSYLTSFPFYLTILKNIYDESVYMDENYTEGFRAYMTMTYRMYQDVKAIMDKFDMNYGSLEAFSREMEEVRAQYDKYLEELKGKVADGYFNGAPGKQGERGSDAIVAEGAGILAFQILDGNLMCYYYQQDPPPMEINGDGELVYLYGGEV